MDVHGLGISGTGSDQVPFNPLEFLADVAINESGTRDGSARPDPGAADVELDSAMGSISIAPLNNSHSSDATAETKFSGEPENVASDNAKDETDTAGEPTQQPSHLEAMQEAEDDDQLYQRSSRASLTPEELAATGIEPDNVALVSSLEEKDQGFKYVFENFKRRRLCDSAASIQNNSSKIFDFFDAFSNSPELLMELAKHLPVDNMISLYAISRDFHETLNGHLTHIMKSYAAYHAPESGRIFVFTLYRSLCIPDPVGRLDHKNLSLPRQVPSLKWLRMIIYREKRVRDILACMAREGHRMPKTMSLSLKKMWLTMDISTSSRRVHLVHNEKYWTDSDLYNIQLFFVKLDMRFNDPVDGSGYDGLRKLMLGQRGLTPLCNLLKRTAFREKSEFIGASLRYSYQLAPGHENLVIFDVPANEIGRGHLEGWGLGNVHLYRMDELMMREACRRNLHLENHLMAMLIWGYVDPVTNENIKVTAEEMYMSDDEQGQAGDVGDNIGQCQEKDHNFVNDGDVDSEGDANMD